MSRTSSDNDDVSYSLSDDVRDIIRVRECDADIGESLRVSFDATCFDFAYEWAVREIVKEGVVCVMM